MEFNILFLFLLCVFVFLLVIDGVFYGNVGLNDIVVDDIELVDVLKGVMVLVLYGVCGGVGVVMIIIKKGKEEGLNVIVNSSMMFVVGYLRKLEV